MRKHLVLFVLAALPAGAAENPLTGTWTIESSLEGTNRSQTCVLKQTGAELTGACVGDEGTSDFSGQVQGDAASWTISSDWNGIPFTMAFKATLRAPGRLDGTFEMRPMKMAGTFAGTREAGGEAVYAAALARSKTAGAASFPAAPPAPVTEQASAPLASPQVRAKVDALLAQMTLEEKIGQLVQLPGFPGARPEAALRKGGAGSVLWLNDTKQFNALQRVAVEESRLHIPLLFALDVIHGYRTIFPVPLAMAASWDPALVERAQAIAAREARAAGIHWTFAPMVDIARDARWGRIVEGAGEEPFLGEAMAAAQVRGFQGQQLGAPDRVAACAKHFAAYGASEGGRDYDSVNVPESQLRNVYLQPFHAAARAGVATFMSAYMDLNDVPASANHFLLRDVLRKEWGFQGFVVSDAMAPASLVTHGFARQGKDAAYRALAAGVDMDMASGTYSRHVAGLVQEGKLTMAQLDEAVRPILAVKFALGLFEKPYADESRVAAVLNDPAHRQEARSAAQRTMVLLRNEKGTLPLRKELTNVAVIGPLADSRQDTEGSWILDPHPHDAVTVLEGIRTKLGPGAKVSYAKGPEIKREIPSPFDRDPKPAETPAEAEQAFRQAVETARAADTVVMVLGEKQDMAGEAASRASLDLPGRQQELLEAVVALGKPVVLVLLNGRPLSINWASEHVPAILEAWEPGSEGGNAIADVLFGDVNPGGKLPVSFPRAGAHEPLYLAHNVTQAPESAPDFKSRYWDSTSTPLYPFGFGLSYTSFAFSNLKLERPEVEVGETVGVTVDVANTGPLAGDEVVQLYVHQRAGSASRPVRELKGFQRVHLAPGEKRTVAFSLGQDELRYWSSAEKKWVLDAELIDVWVGGDSRTQLRAVLTVTPRTVLAGEAIRPAVLGEAMPGFALPSLQGGEVSLAALRGKNVVLVFPRVQYGEGKWCTICNYGYAELAEIEAAEGVRRSANAEILYVVPFGREVAQRWIDATPDELAKIRGWKNPAERNEKALAFADKAKRHLPMDLDPAKGAHGLPFPILLDADRALTSGLDLFRTEWAGAKAEQLVPAVFVLDATGVVRYKHVAQASTWDRPSGREIVDVLRAVAHSGDAAAKR